MYIWRIGDVISYIPYCFFNIQERPRILTDFVVFDFALKKKKIALEINTEYNI